MEKNMGKCVRKNMIKIKEASSYNCWCWNDEMLAMQRWADSVDKAPASIWSDSWHTLSRRFQVWYKTNVLMKLANMKLMS